MRILIVRHATDIAALQAGSAPQLARLQALNPHVDVARLEPGATLLLPDDAPDASASTQDPTRDTFGDFVRQTEAGFKAAAEQLHRSADRLATERSAVTGAAKSAAVKRLLDADAPLREQLQAAVEASTTEQKQAQQAQKTVETLQQTALQELAALRRLTG